jgi:hypothetical protein
VAIAAKPNRGRSPHLPTPPGPRVTFRHCECAQAKELSRHGYDKSNDERKSGESAANTIRFAVRLTALGPSRSISQARSTSTERAYPAAAE